MSELNDVEVNKKLLAGVSETLRAKLERLANISRSVEGLKKTLFGQIDAGLWDQAQATLDQMRKLAIDGVSAANEAREAQARADGLEMAVKRAEEAERRRLAQQKPYTPYAPEPATKPEPKPEPAAKPEPATKPEAEA